MKHLLSVFHGLFKWSPPARGRGLKLRSITGKLRAQIVAPRAGAWIETE